MITDVKNLKLIGEGERSKVYQHPTIENRVIKVTKSKVEKEVINYFYENPNPLFVQIFNVEKKGAYIYAEIEKLPCDSVAFTLKKGGRFVENMFRGWTFRHAIGGTYEANYIQEVAESVEESKEEVEKYYDFLKQADRIGLSIFDTAWNLGRRADGSLCCFDSTMV